MIRFGQNMLRMIPAIQPPGTEYGCRCTATPHHGIVDPPVEPVYPELLLLPLFRLGRLLAAWRAWLRARDASRNWQLSPTKSATKWRNQLEKGNWTPKKISRTIRYGQPFSARNERTGGQPHGMNLKAVISFGTMQLGIFYR